MADLKLAEGEYVVRSYRCTAVDRCKVIAGTAIPLGSKKRQSEGNVVVTNMRVVYSMEATGRGQSMVRQEARISDISSVSSLMARFGRDLRVPIALILMGILLIFAPFVYATESGALENDGDYNVGYNLGLEYGYYGAYVDAVTSGTVENTIPEGYTAPVRDEFGSARYDSGWYDGARAGAARAAADMASEKDFSVPNDMKVGDMGPTVLAVSAVGTVVFVLGSVMYAISSRTKDWVLLKMGGASGSGIFLKSMSPCTTDLGPTVAGEDFSSMVCEIGSVIADLRSSQGGRAL